MKRILLFIAVVIAIVVLSIGLGIGLFVLDEQFNKGRTNQKQIGEAMTISSNAFLEIQTRTNDLLLIAEPKTNKWMTFTNHPFEYYVAQVYNSFTNDMIGYFQFGPRPDAVEVSMVTPIKNLWTATNLLITTEHEPVVTNRDGLWRITFRP